ncbi:MAG: hyuA [Solirubrobacterales bacterium]|nr:hyuA [Solirubrobacterales bacterium]
MAADPRVRLGIDIGGTFTDLVLADDGGRIVMGKELTASSDLALGTVASACSFVDAHGVAMSQVDEIVHGTTLGSNVVLERKGWPTALFITEGFRDVLVIQRGRRHHLYDLFGGKPEPLIPRSRVLEVPERIAFDGGVVRDLDEDAVARLARQAVDLGVEAVAISLLHSYQNPRHERAVAAIVRREAPGLFVSISSEISQRFREYERASTTVINAYIAGEVRRYLRDFERRLRRAGFAGVLHVMQSNGGVAGVDTVSRHPVRLLESGPAAGALMAGQIAAASGRPLAISFDMGGTTAKVGLTEDGIPGFTDEFEVDRLTVAPGSGLPVDLTAVDLVEIGAGGGSVATASAGLVAVGHESAGSEPGPACYQRGGDRPTVTDANLVLGYLDPDHFLGGEMRLSVEAARRAIETHVAGPLGLTVEEAAWGIHELATESMAAAVRVVSVDRGKDPRDFCLVAFGGAGPAHAVRIAKRGGIPTVIFPPGAGVVSAMGLLSCDIRFEAARSALLRIDHASTARINGIYQELEASLHALLHESDADPERTATTRSADLRYAGQGYELEVAVEAADVDEGALAAAVGRFHERYHEIYGYSDRLRAVEATTWRLTGTSSRPRLELPPLEPGRSDGVVATRPVYFDEAGTFVACPVYRRADLPTAAIVGPAVIEERECTSIIPPGCTVELDPRGNLTVTVEPERSPSLVPLQGTHA